MKSYKIRTIFSFVWPFENLIKKYFKSPEQRSNSVQTAKKSMKMWKNYKIWAKCVGGHRCAGGCRCAGAQVQVCTVMQVQTQYIFAVYCVVHKIPSWLDPPTTTTTYLFLRPRTSLTCGQKKKNIYYRHVHTL